VLHGTLRLADGGPLHADLALNLSQSINEVLPSREDELAFRVAVNTARKAFDDKQLELLKSGKRQPVPVSSRCYSLRRKQFTFWHVGQAEIDQFVERKIFWAGGLERQPVLVSDACDAMYLDAADEHMQAKLLAAAKQLAERGMAEPVVRKLVTYAALIALVGGVAIVSLVAAPGLPGLFGAALGLLMIAIAIAVSDLALNKFGPSVSQTFFGKLLFLLKIKPCQFARQPCPLLAIAK